MDSRTMRLAVISMVSVLLLIGVIVYASNAERFGELIGSRSGQKASTEASEELPEGTVVTDTPLGEQIGDNLQGYLLDADFFDKGANSASVIVTTGDKPPAYPTLETIGYVNETEDAESAGTTQDTEEETDGEAPGGDLPH
ncbi:MAG: hypothetical protein IJT34_06165 [Butyrivibrio sp.]|nr:hypothetical protein [Butyrivibrio sp.]